MQRSVNKADRCRCLLQWLGGGIKLDEEAISEILVADTDSESGSEASNFENYFQEEEEEEDR